MKKNLFPLFVILIISILLAACGPLNLGGSAGGGGGNEKVTICHATGSSTNPYVEITVSYNATDGTYKENNGNGSDHSQHLDDLIPAPAEGCPKGATDTPEPSKTPKQNEKIKICHATGSATNPYVEIEVSVNATDGSRKDANGADHSQHINDMIPAPPEGCPKGATSTPEPSKTPKQNEKIKICHATGSATNPYVEIEVSVNATDGSRKDANGADHSQHPDDMIPAPPEGCPKGATNTPTNTPQVPTNTPTPTSTPEVNKITLCHSTGEGNNYIEVTVPLNAAGKHGHEGHSKDIIPIPATGCPVDIVITPPPPPPADCPQWLIFHTFRDENLEVYRLNGVEGSPDAKLINLSQSDATDCRPSRSPNDAFVVFQSDRDGNIELYLTGSDQGAPTRMTTTESNNINPMFGSDNKTVVFQSDRNGNWDIFTINKATGSDQQLTSDPADDVNPFYSPDLRWIVFQSNRNGNWDLFLLDTTTGNEFQLVATKADDIFPAWSPNGKYIAYLSELDGVWNLYIITVKTRATQQVTFGVGNTGNHTWSPEGERIAYQSNRKDNLDIYTFDLGDKKEYRLTDFAGPDSSPTWDCSGTNIAFTSTRDGNPNLFQVFWKGGPQSNLTIDPSTDKWSEWSPSKEPGSRGE